MDEDQDDIKIETIFVKASYNNTFEYIINDGQIHVLDRDDMYRMIINLLPAKHNQLDYLLGTKTPFIAVINELKLYEMSYKIDDVNYRELLKTKTVENRENVVDNSISGVANRQIDKLNSQSFFYNK